jgi:ABC-2 type transport system ATP-binding protein
MPAGVKMIEIGNVAFGYGPSRLFQDLNVDFGNGRIYGLLGKNGAGKTSLLKLICGLLRPATGYCEVLGFDSRKRLPGMLQDLFFIPESYYLPAVSIERFEALHAPLYSGFDCAAFSDYLKEMELNKGQSLNTLSYGLSKRVLLAFGLATNARILLLDEPTNGLDIPSKRVFRKLLAGSIDERRVFIIATHQIKELENIFDNLVFIDQGRILLNSSLATINDRLLFRTTTSAEQLQNAVYHEEIAGGYAVIEKNLSGEHGTLDLEFLFNAVVGSTEDFLALLHQEKEYDSE